MYNPLYSRMPDVIRSVQLSATLEKLACANHQDPELYKSAWVAKIAVDAEIFSHAQNFSRQMEKTASAGTEAVKAVVPNAMQNLGKGLGYGVGIGLPLAATGAYIAHRGRKEAEQTATNVRNQVLLTALGLGGIGAGVYGLSRLMGKESSDGSLKKQAALQESETQELTEKLASVGMLEDLLDQVDFEKLSAEAKDEYLQTRALNRSYGVRLLYEAMQA